MAAIREVLDGLDVDDALGGESGQLVRQSLAEHGRRAEVLGDAARAVAQAVQARRANVAERDAATPSDSETRAAQEAVVRASNAYADGTGTKEQPSLSLRGCRPPNAPHKRPSGKRNRRRRELSDGDARPA